jgi:nucleotide-binding universal stress UspA family protein
MTIIAGFSASRQGTAPLHLAAQLSRCTGARIVAAAIVERPWPTKSDPVEDEYLSYVGMHAQKSLDRMAARLPDDLDVWQMVHQATSIPEGLTELAAEMDADVVVGSSSSGLLGSRWAASPIASSTPPRYPWRSHLADILGTPAR